MREEERVDEGFLEEKLRERENYRIFSYKIKI